MLKRFLPFIGIDGRRFHYTWVSASEGQRWQQTVTQFTRQIHELGPASGEAENAAAITPGATPQAAAGRGAALTAPSKEQVETLKKAVIDALSKVDVVVGWKQGFDPLHVEPFFIEKPEQADQTHILAPLRAEPRALFDASEGQEGRRHRQGLRFPDRRPAFAGRAYSAG